MCDTCILGGIYAALLLGTPAALAGDCQERPNSEIKLLIQFVAGIGP